MQSMITKVTKVIRKKVSASLREKGILFRMFVLIWFVIWFTCSIGYRSEKSKQFIMQTTIT